MQSLSNAHAKRKSTVEGEGTSSRGDNLSPGGKWGKESQTPQGDGRVEPMVLEVHDGYKDSWHGGRHLEMPIFNGKNLKGWIFRAELFFEMNHLLEMGEDDGCKGEF